MDFVLRNEKYIHIISYEYEKYIHIFSYEYEKYIHIFHVNMKNIFIFWGILWDFLGVLSPFGKSKRVPEKHLFLLY